MTEFHFAYGSNMSSEVMKGKLKEGMFKFVGLGKLPNYRFAYDGISKIWKGSVGNVWPAGNEYVLGAIYKIDQIFKGELDKTEGVYSGTYESSTKFIHDMKNSVFPYIVYPRTPQPQYAVNQNYIKAVVGGARERKLPERYIHKYLYTLLSFNPDIRQFKQVKNDR